MPAAAADSLFSRSARSSATIAWRTVPVPDSDTVLARSRQAVALAVGVVGGDALDRAAQLREACVGRGVGVGPDEEQFGGPDVHAVAWPVVVGV